MAGPPSFANYQRNAADNTGGPPYGAPEGWPGRDINDVMREVMAAGRRLFDDTPRRATNADGGDDPYYDRRIGTLAYQQSDAVEIEGGTIVGVPGVVPVGSVTLWWGTLAAAAEHQNIGFIIGDGRRVVRADGLAFTAPDLRDIFPYFYSSARAPQSKAGTFNITTAAAGGHTHGSDGRTGNLTLNVSHLPAITFSRGIESASGSGIVEAGNDYRADTFTGGGEPHTHGIADAPAHTHTATYLPPHAVFVPLWRGW